MNNGYYYPWYFDDWFLSESRLFMNLEERGLYRELLDRCYRDGSLPNNPDTCRRIASASEDEFSRAWDKVRARFHEGDDGRLHHARVDSVRAEVDAARSEKSERARANARKRWGSDNGCNGNATAMQPHSGGNAMAMPNDASKVKESKVNVSPSGDTARARRASSPSPDSDPDPPPESPPDHRRKPPAVEHGFRSAGQVLRRPSRVVDLSAYPAESVAYVRSSLDALAAAVHLPRPDDGIVRDVLDAARGAPGDEIAATLRTLYVRDRFANIRSWGLVPTVLGACYADTVRAG